MKPATIFILIGIFISGSLNAQLKKDEELKIDSLFIEWNEPNNPGGAIAIMKDEKIVYSKAYGLASLEYLVPNSPGTMFNVGSVSKQFTAMAIVLLQLQGKLNIEDDIKLYIPELIQFEHTINIRQMLQHTSGLRSFHALLGLAGWRSDDSRSNEDLYRFMSTQKDLNFIPGSQYLYSNTGYMLAAKIIEKVTNEAFPVWMKKNVFEPLGLTNTYVEDRYNRVVPNNAMSYHKISDDEYVRAVEYWGYVGSGNVHSTTGDLLKWLNNFNKPQKGWKKAFKLLLTLNNLNNGRINNYALGIVIDKALGYERIQHAGSIGGFSSYVSTFPNEKLSIVLLTNFSSSSTVQKVNRISRILLPIKETKTTTVVDIPEEIVTIRLPVKELKKFESWYWNDNQNYSRRVYLKDDTLRYFRGNSNESPLIPIDNKQFKMLNTNLDIRVYFDIKENKEKNMIVSVNGGGMIISESYTPKKITIDDLKEYTGNYFSPELQTNYQIKLIKNKLYIYHARFGNISTVLLKENVMECGRPIGIAKFNRDENGKILGMKVSNGRVRNLWFEKSK